MTPLRPAARSIGLVHPVDRPQGRVPSEGTTDSREDGMTPRTDERKIEINRGLLVGGAVLMSVGAVVGMAGAPAPPGAPSRGGPGGGRPRGGAPPPPPPPP